MSTLVIIPPPDPLCPVVWRAVPGALYGDRVIWGGSREQRKNNNGFCGSLQYVASTHTMLLQLKNPLLQFYTLHSLNSWRNDGVLSVYCNCGSVSSLSYFYIWVYLSSQKQHHILATLFTHFVLFYLSLCNQKLQYAFWGFALLGYASPIFPHLYARTFAHSSTTQTWPDWMESICEYIFLSLAIDSTILSLLLSILKQVNSHFVGWCLLYFMKLLI